MLGFFVLFFWEGQGVIVVSSFFVFVLLFDDHYRCSGIHRLYRYR